MDFPELHLGFGRHHYYIAEYNYEQYLRLSFSEWIQTFLTLMFTKISICLLLLRIVVSEKLVRPLQGMIGFLVLSTVILELLWILQCSPVEAAWDGLKKETARCFSDGQVERIVITQASVPCLLQLLETRSLLMISVISIISDFVLAAFPLVILGRAKIKRQTKILLCSLMGLGVL